MEENLRSDHYKQFVGKWAKRFYTSFDYHNMFRIVDFKLKPIDTTSSTQDGEIQTQVQVMAYFTVIDDSDGEKWDWDVEDCIIISDKPSDDPRVAYVKSDEYRGDNPYDL